MESNSQVSRLPGIRLIFIILIVLVVVEGAVILVLALVPPSCRIQVIDWQCVVVPQSNADHGDTLEAVIRGISTEPSEYAAVFCGDRKIFEVTNGDENSVRHLAPAPDTHISEMVHVHNHPAAEGYAFSYGDLKSYALAQYYERGIVVTPDVVHILAAPRGWPDVSQVRNYFTRQLRVDLDVFVKGSEADHNTIWDQTYARLLELEQDGYVILGLGSDDESGSHTVGLTSKLIEQLARHFGLTYTTEPIPGD